jgi:phosphopantothenoylcysteine decarboxylase / phosphopantothenate---cysteine ligase
VGFALETDDGLINAREKMKSKELDLIVLNDATEPGSGFGVDTNRVTLISRDGRQEEIPLMSKSDLAEVLIDRIEEELGGR